MKNEYGLTPQQDRFALLLGSGLSQAEAYRQAYPSSLKWKADSVHQKASTLASHVKVAKRVAEIQTVSAEKAALDGAEVLRELKRMAHSDIGNIMTAEGRVKLPHELDPATRAAVASFKIDEYGRIEYKFWDKNSAVDKAMKHLGLYKEDNSQQPPPVIQQVRLVALRKQGVDKP